MLHHIYCDESRQCQDRYMVLGGIIINDKSIDEFNSTIAKYRHEEKMTSELKWSKISNQYKEKYKRFIDYFFALNNNHEIHFKCLIVDNHKVDYRKYSHGNYEVGFYKWYYQLILHKFLLKYHDVKEDTKFLINLDERTSSYKLYDLKKVLNNGFKKRTRLNTDPVRNVEPRNSKLCEVIQINDLILGAIGFQKNGNHLLAGSRQAKIELAEHIAKSAGLRNLQDDTKWGQHRFEIWNIKLQ